MRRRGQSLGWDTAGDNAWDMSRTVPTNVRDMGRDSSQQPRRGWLSCPTVPWLAFGGPINGLHAIL